MCIKKLHFYRQVKMMIRQKDITMGKCVLVKMDDSTTNTTESPKLN